jgi:hypothetical protein
MVNKGSAHHSPSLAPILNQINPVQALQSCFFLIYSNIILPHIPWLRSGHFSSSFPTKTPQAFFLFPTHATRPAHLIFLYLTTVVIFGKGYNFRKLDYEYGRLEERVEDRIDKTRSENKFTILKHQVLYDSFHQQMHPFITHIKC